MCLVYSRAAAISHQERRASVAREAGRVVYSETKSSSMGLDATTAAEVAAVVTLAVLIVAIVAASAGACGGGARAAAVHDVELALGSDTLVTYDQATAALKSIIIRRKASSSPAPASTEEEKKEPEEAAEAPPCCALCLSEYAGGGGELVRVVPACGHFFHAECGVDWWLKKRGTCPLCRGELVSVTSGHRRRCRRRRDPSARRCRRELVCVFIKLARRSRVPELAAGSSRRRPSSPASTSDTAGCPPSPRMRLASADPALATASPPRTAGPCRRRRCPPVQTATFASPACSFPRSVASRLAHARLPPAARLRARVDTARGANTAATWLSVPALLSSLPSILSLPSRSYISSQQFPSLKAPEKPRRTRSRAQPSSLLPRPNQGSLELPQPPLLLTEQSPHQIHHQSPRQLRRRSRTRTARFPPPPAKPRAPLASSCHAGAHRPFPRASPTLTSPAAAHRSCRAATVVAEHDSGHPRPRDLAQTSRGEPLFTFPYFPGPVSPPFGRRNHAGEPWTEVYLQPLSRGPSAKVQGPVLYELVPAAEEVTQESEVNVVHVDPSPEQEYRFEPEGKPRSIT
ncbi:hypothetical protein HU200_050883 [Digitaria exilis]|uniref:RING-type domain-containing protein n=1 Tax=Digitaria exilis TaxID=1010633 RepID=A0A835E9Z9_9POAL|nr:hypothetical protein HU200_050883 [Digitaria exilis]